MSQRTFVRDIEEKKKQGKCENGKYKTPDTTRRSDRKRVWESTYTRHTSKTEREATHSHKRPRDRRHRQTHSSIWLLFKRKQKDKKKIIIIIIINDVMCILILVCRTLYCCLNSYLRVNYLCLAALCTLSNVPPFRWKIKNNNGKKKSKERYWLNQKNK